MNSRFRIVLVGLLAGTALSATPGFAADPAGLEEIVVTARRQAESLQEAPLSITALSAQTIQSAGIDDLRDVARLAPGLRFDDLIAGLFASPVIRGLAVSNLLSENNVGTFLDGVYISNKAGLDLSLVDLERIEVVKGPQSALYGRNTFAGAINYVTRTPSDTLSGRVRLTGGNDGLAQGLVSLGGPIGGRGLRASVAALYGRYDGGYTEAVSGDDLGGYDKWAVNLNLRFEPSEALSIGAGFYYGDDRAGPAVIARLPNNCALAAMAPVFTDYCGAVPDLEDLRTEASTRNPLLEANDRTLQLANLTIDYRFGDGYRIQSLTGYNDVDSRSYGEFDRRQNGGTFNLVGGGTVLANVWIGENNQARDLSQELRLSSPRERSLRWSLGAFYYDSDSVRAVPVAIDGSNIPAGRSIASPFAYLVSADGTTVPTFSLDNASVRQQSAFGTIEGDVNDQLTLTAELRHTEERKQADSIRNVFAGGADLDGAGQSGTFDFVDARLVARWQWSDSVNLYVSAASGSKSGGFNSGALNVAERTFDPERNWTYELGAKTEWADGRMRLNGALYFVDWRDVQLSVPQNSASPASIIQNAGKVEARGIELELTARLAQNLELGLGASVGSPEFKDSYTTSDAAACAAIPGCRTETRSFGGVNRLVAILDGNQLARAYKEQGYVYLEYERPLTTTWTGFSRVDYSYAGKEYDRAINTSFIPSRSLVDLRLGLRDDRWTITLFAENLLDDTTPTAATRQTDLANFQNFLDIVGGQRRRSIGLTAAYEF